MSEINRALAAQALVQAGARYRPIYHTPTDENGVATGEAARTGCILGVIYTPGKQGVLRIDTPGTVQRAEQEHLEGILTDGAPRPVEGDTVRVSGRARRITDVSCGGGILYTLTLADE